MDQNQEKTILTFFERLPGPVFAALCAASVLLIGLLDFLTGYEISVSVLYLLPIMLVGWLKGRGPAVILAIISSLVWMAADTVAGHVYSHYAIPVWNAIMGLAVFLIVGFSIAAIKELLLKERKFAYTDFLTGVANARSFYEQTQKEVTRSVRYRRPISVAYIDIDNFKDVNDTLGHLAGDEVLQNVAKAIQSTVRSTDSISRLGGDEFAVLMPETNDGQANLVVHKIQERLRETVKEHGWPITFSIGAITCLGPVCTMDRLIQAADELMYNAKKEGKDTARFKVLANPSDES